MLPSSPWSRRSGEVVSSELDERPPLACCGAPDYGGSHWHCARCNALTGMYDGHYKDGEFGNDRKWHAYAERHMCCPGNCEKPEAHR